MNERPSPATATGCATGVATLAGGAVGIVIGVALVIAAVVRPDTTPTEPTISDALLLAPCGLALLLLVVIGRVLDSPRPSGCGVFVVGGASLIVGVIMGVYGFSFLAAAARVAGVAW